MIDFVSLIIIFIILAACLGIMYLGYLKLQQAYENRDFFKNKFEKEMHFRKSSEVRLGKIGENLAPFVKDWPWPARNFRFLGNPVDGVQFNDDEIIFIEIKTGNARLSKSQKKAKKLVEQGKVNFVTFKITENGSKLIREGEVEEL